MKDNTTNVIPIANGSGINGNIGSCQVNSTDVTTSFLYTTTIAMNSCNGTIISENTYINQGWIAIPIVLFIMIFIGFCVYWANKNDY